MSLNNKSDNSITVVTLSIVNLILNVTFHVNMSIQVCVVKQRQQVKQVESQDLLQCPTVAK